MATTTDVQGRRYARGLWPMDGSPDDGFYADITVGERGEGMSTITKHPIDRNSVITDHVFQEPRALSMTVAVGAKEGATFADVFAKLDAWRTSATLLMVQTGKRLYTNMLIAYLTETTGADTENVLWLDVGIQQVNIVEMQTGELPPRQRQRLPKKTASKEVQGTKQTIAEAPKKKQSALAGLLPADGDGLGGMLQKGFGL